MKKLIFNKAGMKLIRTEDATPICGEDFCEHCGDCLRCYAEDDCYYAKDGEHQWVEYED